MTDHISAVYDEKNIDLSWLIGSSANYDENQKGQQCD